MELSSFLTLNDSNTTPTPHRAPASGGQGFLFPAACADTAVYVARSTHSRTGSVRDNVKQPIELSFDGASWFSLPTAQQATAPALADDDYTFSSPN
ncbi:hypothetical protein GN244_ATG13401 [Phytophthora infestans]|uniref:Uncharacterized protein n=1 Tax=Phytophthora infestans TaxID=4787 RepID=A0A833SHV7_PHYIN|nr:hypothetical protein GN244_ATG17202 [Phytophthora infestans]KAF4034657.1 hypothetical protein GN244_ATG13401 [Phytophthora infestans]KAF4149109.1 hypothetical protein GN958_ATG01650 [Phytophthora infestans]